MKKTTLGLLLLVFLSGAGFGTELELSKARNPFDFGRGIAGERTLGHKPVSRLGMVVDAGGNHVAYIDGTPRKLGDVIDGARITDITLKYVVLVSPRKTWRLYVEPFREKE